tara:strand:+ start:1093 stop:1425 length:333 start_codon:yes stop_codon:yes gene_type:complete
MPTKKNDYTDAVPPGKKRPRKGSQPKLYGEPKNYPQSNKFIGELTKAREANKKSFIVDGKEYMVKMSGGGPHPKNMGYAEKFTPENFSEKTKAMMYKVSKHHGGPGKYHN